MSNCVIYCDGSGKNQAASWALVGLWNDQQHELHGRYMFKHINDLHAFESVAFLQACMFAHERGIAPSQTTIFTDDQALSSINSVWNPENFAPGKITLLQRFQKLLPLMGLDPSILPKLEPYFLHARISHIRGHRGFVYQERVDYLAKCAALEQEPLSYDEWLIQGVAYWRNNDEIYRYPFAFVPLAEEDHLPNIAEHPLQLDGSLYTWSSNKHHLPIREFVALAGLSLKLRPTTDGWSAELQEKILNEPGGYPIHARGYGMDEEQALIDLSRMLAGKAYTRRRIAGRSGPDLVFPESWKDIAEFGP